MRMDLRRLAGRITERWKKELNDAGVPIEHDELMRLEEIIVEELRKGGWKQ